jgi:hypothetical protein
MLKPETRFEEHPGSYDRSDDVNDRTPAAEPGLKLMDVILQSTALERQHTFALFSIQPVDRIRLQGERILGKHPYADSV